MKRLVKVAALVMLALVVVASAQVTAIAKKGTGITVDGDPSEWANADKIELAADIGMQLTTGSIDNRSDASGEFSVLWNDEGFYCASWCKDDVHNTPWTNQPGMTNQSWKDDGHEYWVSFDFNDVWEDASPPYYGQFGWQVWKGWSWSDGAMEDLYIAYRNDNPPTNTTTAELVEQGFTVKYTSGDGINFNTEAHWKWSSFLLGSMSSPSAGKELGFNIGLNDNDGGDGGDGWLRWAEGNHGNYQGWGKVTISDDPIDVKIRPVRVSPVAMQGQQLGRHAYDVFGRKVSAHSARNVLIYGNAAMGSRSAKRAIILR